MRRSVFPILAVLVIVGLISPVRNSADSQTILSLNADSLLSTGFSDRMLRKGRPSVALALSGGGARGLAQIGVLKAIEKSGLQIDLVTGTSMGGVVGGLWAAGFSADSIEKQASSIQWSGFFSDKPQRSSLFLTQRDEGEKQLITLRFNGFRPTIPTALTAGQKLTSLLNKFAIEANYRSRHDFGQLKVPLLICAVDILKAEPVVLKRGNLADALRATMSVPLAFTPLETDTSMLMDGGLLMPIPVRIARENGADFVIAVNTTADLLPRERISDPIDIANQTTTIMQLEARQRELENADVVVSPELGDRLSTDFENINQLIDVGEAAMNKALPGISAAVDSLRSMVGDSVLYVDSIDLVGIADSVEALRELREHLNLHCALGMNQLRDAALTLLLGGSTIQLEAKLVESEGLSILQIRAEALPLSFAFRGNESLDDSILRNALASALKQKGQAVNLIEAYRAFTMAYRDAGYDLMEIDSIRVNHDRDSTIFFISEGLVSRVMISGNRRTKGWVIKRSFTIKPGKPFNLLAAENGMANIYSSGLFERVNFDVERQGQSAVVRINVKEKRYDLIRLGAHYHDHYHAETFADFADGNLLGFSNELFFRVHYGEMRKAYSLHLKADRIFETYMTYHIMLFHERLKRDRYEKNESFGFNRERRSGAILAFGQQMSRFGTVTIEARAERVRIDLPAFSGLIHRSLRSIILRSRVDNFDKYPFPDKGVASHFYLELASDVFGGEDRFKKVWFDWRGQIPLTRALGIQPAFAVGLSDVTLPSFEKLRLGGNRDFFGYQYQALEGDNLARVNLGVRISVPYKLYFTTRYDVGDVWSKIEDASLNRLQHAFGFELAYDSPVGPVSISYGRAEGKHDRFYIDVGYDF